MEACLTSTFSLKLQQMVNYPHFKISITYHHFIQKTSLQGIMQVIALEFQIHVWSPTIGIGNRRCLLHFIESLAKQQPLKVLRIFMSFKFCMICITTKRKDQLLHYLWALKDQNYTCKNEFLISGETRFDLWDWLIQPLQYYKQFCLVV